MEAADGERPPSKETVSVLLDTLRARARQQPLRAVGACYDVRVAPSGQSTKTDAICAQAEHVNGEAYYVYLPYREGLLRKVKFGQLFAEKAESQVFGAPGQGV